MPALTAVVAAAALVLAGCTASSADPSATALPTGVTVELQQLRADVAPRQMQVHVTNESDEPLTVGAVRVEDDRFDGPAVRVIADRESVVRPGGSVDIRVQLPAVDCTAGDAGESRVVLEILSASAATEVAASARDRLGFLAPLHERECLYERVTDAATLAFTGFTPSAPGEPATLQLTVSPTGTGEAVVTGIEGTNLLDFGSAGTAQVYPLDLAVRPGDTAPVVREIPLVPFRCDPHAVQEDKRGTIFEVRVELEGEPGEFQLFVGEELRGRILTWVADWCGFGG